MKQKKDHIFVIVMGLVLANLVFSFAGYLSVMWVVRESPFYWTILLANILAILGVLMLLRAYRKGRRIGKEEEKTNTQTGQKMTKITPPKKSNILVRIFRFFIPKDFKAELTKGRMTGGQIRQGKITPKNAPYVVDRKGNKETNRS